LRKRQPSLQNPRMKLSCMPLLACLAFSAVGATRVSDGVLSEAQGILASVKSTKYTHREDIDASEGRYNLDCSHFVGLVLERTAPDALHAIPKESNFKYPRAFSFCDFFVGLIDTDTNWEQIKALADAKGGDVIAWRMEPFDPTKDTGHVAILSKSPEKQDDGTYMISVIDASEVRHYDDSRPKGTTGVGTGSLHIRVDGQGHLTAVQFNDRAHWHEHVFGIGRLKS